MSYWLVGESPHPATVGRPDLWLTPDESGLPHTANRLLRLTGWTLDLFLQIFDRRTNVWTSPIHRWFADGRRNAARIAEEVCHDAEAQGVVVLGAKAARAFNLGDDEPLEWIGSYVFVPHPSGRCQFWNEPGNRAAAEGFFGEIARSSNPRHQRGSCRGG